MNPKKETNIMKTFRFLVALTALLAPTAILRAQSFTYTVENSKTTITGFSAEPSGAVVVPSTLGGYTVTEIGRAAFKDRTAITSISFASGASVTKLGAMAFHGCTGLQSISMPSGTTALPAGVLQGCASLTAVTIPGTVTSIGPMAFADCGNLASVTLPSSLVSLGESAFTNCSSLSTLSLPAGVTTVPPHLFNECRTLSSVTMAGNVTSIGANAFHHCVSLTAFSLATPVTTLGDGAFSGCEGLVSLSIGTGLSAIGDLAFQGCDSLASITVASGNTSFSSADGVLFNADQTILLLCPPAKAGAYAIPSGVAALGHGAFAHCAHLTSISLPSALTSIADDAFYYATSLGNAPITNSITSIGTWAYAGLKQLQNLTIPASVTSIGADAFHSSTSLAWVIFHGNAPAAMGDEAFDAAADGFTVYFHSSASGFTTPEWMGYTAVALDISPTLIDWLTDHGFTPGTSLLSDSNHDGVPLLVAYALGLDPTLDLSGSLPVPVLANGVLSLSFQGNSNGILYGAQTSTDLQSWTASGVTLTEPDANGQRRASITKSGGGSRFLRLVFGTE